MSTEQTTGECVNIIWDNSTFSKIWRNKPEEGKPYYRSKIGHIYTDQKTGETCESFVLDDNDLLRLSSLAERTRTSIRHFQRLDRDQAQEHERKQDEGSEARQQFRQSRQQAAPNRGEDLGRQP